MKQKTREEIKEEKYKKEKINKAKKKIILVLVPTLLAVLSNMYLVYNIIKLSNIENFLRLLVCCIIIILSLLLFFIGYKVLISKKKKGLIIFIVITLLLFGITAFINYNMHLVYSKINNTNQSYKTYTLSLVTKKSNKVKKIDEIDNSKIGVINDKNIANGYTLAEDIINEEGLSNSLKGYDTYLEIVQALYADKIKYAFLPESYANMFTNYDEYKKIDEDIKTIYTKEKKEKEESVQKSIDEPFTVLFMGVDTLENSYNADTLLVVTFNPKTLSTTMVSIPRDSYATIACTGGKHKINSSGWYGDKCVVNTVSKYLDVKIDYYAKVNFTGIVNLVDAIGGIDVDVPYALCEQDSKRRFGDYLIYIEEGIQHLNGEQALALSRNRHYWTGMCPKKYTTDGNRSDFQRGRNQQLVFKAMLQKLSTVRKVSTFYSLLDTLSENITTNMDTDTILSFYNIGKKILIKLDNKSIDEVLNIQRLGFTSTTPSLRISGMLLSMVVNSDESIKAVQTAMKENLGLISKEAVKKFSFDINDPYVEVITGTNLSSKTSLNRLPDFTEYTLQQAINYLEKNDINYKTYPNDRVNGVTYKIISQSPDYYVDVDTMNKTKGVTLYIEAANKEEESISFDYSVCIESSNKTNDDCRVPNFTTITAFNNWVSKVNQYVNTSTTSEITDDSTKSNKIISITGKNGSVVGLSIYELYTEKISISAKYYEYKETTQEDNNDTTNE